MEEKELAAATWILIASAAVAAAVAPAGDPLIEGKFSAGDGNVTLSLEVADSPAEREKGLMNRKSLREDRGMVFVYPGEKERTFWMKNTSIPLDIIFIDAERRVVNIEQADPEPGVPDGELERYRSDSPAKYVVEVNQGFAGRNGIEEGSVFYFSRR